METVTEDLAARERNLTSLSNITLIFTLTAVSMTFGALIVVFLMRALREDYWTKIQLPGILWLSTAILLASSFLFHFASKKLMAGDSDGFHRLMTWTITAGVLFLLSQITAGAQILNSGVVLTNNPHSWFIFLVCTVSTLSPGSSASSYSGTAPANASPARAIKWARAPPPEALPSSGTTWTPCGLCSSLCSSSGNGKRLRYPFTPPAPSPHNPDTSSLLPANYSRLCIHTQYKPESYTFCPSIKPEPVESAYRLRPKSYSGLHLSCGLSDESAKYRHGSS
jgi:hypothetical protein